MMSLYYTCYVLLIASALAFDHYGQLTQQLEDQTEMKEKAEQLALQVHT